MQETEHLEHKDRVKLKIFFLTTKQITYGAGVPEPGQRGRA
jgi:hypothetical protein